MHPGSTAIPREQSFTDFILRYATEKMAASEVPVAFWRRLAVSCTPTGTSSTESACFSASLWSSMTYALSSLLVPACWPQIDAAESITNQRTMPAGRDQASTPPAAYQTCRDRITIAESSSLDTGWNSAIANHHRWRQSRGQDRDQY